MRFDPKRPPGLCQRGTNSETRTVDRPWLKRRPTWVCLRGQLVMAYLSANRFRAMTAVASSRSVASHLRPVALAAARNAPPPA